jgi:hypothetical protein
MIRSSTNVRAGAVQDVCWSGFRGFAVLAVLLLPVMSAAQIQNPSFEQARSVTPYPDTAPSYWWLAYPDGSPFGSQVTRDWKTLGNRSAGLFGRCNRLFAAGEYQGLYQRVVLTGIAAISFDVQLIAYGPTFPTPFRNFKASVLVDGVPLWTRSAGGVYLNQQVDVSNLSPGSHVVELRNTATTAGQFVDTAYWVQWDNLRVVKMPEEKIIEAVIDVDPNMINLKSKGKWITCYIDLAQGYDAHGINAETVTLNGVSAHVGEEGWATPEASAGNMVDHDGDGILERMVKFDRAALQAFLQTGTITVTVKGKLPSQAIAGGSLPIRMSFKGTDIIRVIGKGGAGE